MDPSPRVLIVSPVKNEAAHLEGVIRAVAAQDFPPARWIVVDDGSSDGTPEIARRLAADIPFMDVLDEGVGGGGRDPLAEGAAPKAFNRGLALVDLGEFTHVMKLDGDVELPPDYLQRLCDAYVEYFHSYEGAPVFALGTDHFNPIEREADFETLVQRLSDFKGKREFFNSHVEVPFG